MENLLKKSLELTQRLDHMVPDPKGSGYSYDVDAAIITHSIGNEQEVFNLNELTREFMQTEDFTQMPIELQREVAIFIENR